MTHPWNSGKADIFFWRWEIIMENLGRRRAAPRVHWAPMEMKQAPDLSGNWLHIDTPSYNKMHSACSLSYKVQTNLWRKRQIKSGNSALHLFIIWIASNSCFLFLKQMILGLFMEVKWRYLGLSEETQEGIRVVAKQTHGHLSTCQWKDGTTV